MKKMSRSRLAVFAMVLIAILATSAMVADVALADDAKPPYVRLTVVNESQFNFSLMLYGPDQLSIAVPAHSEGRWVVKRGLYSFWMRACNYSKSGAMDLTIVQTIHIPICGGNAGALGDKFHHIDVSDYVKPIRIKIRNKTKEQIGLYLRTLEQDFFLNFKPGEIQTLIVPKDEYVYSYTACGELVTGYYTARVTPPLDLKCLNE